MKLDNLRPMPCLSPPESQLLPHYHHIQRRRSAHSARVQVRASEAKGEEDEDGAAAQARHATDQAGRNKNPKQRNEGRAPSAAPNHCRGQSQWVGLRLRLPPALRSAGAALVSTASRSPTCSLVRLKINRLSHPLRTVPRFGE